MDFYIHMVWENAGVSDAFLYSMKERFVPEELTADYDNNVISKSDVVKLHKRDSRLRRIAG